MAQLHFCGRGKAQLKKLVDATDQAGQSWNELYAHMHGISIDQCLQSWNVIIMKIFFENPQINVPFTSTFWWIRNVTYVNVMYVKCVVKMVQFTLYGVIGPVLLLPLGLFYQHGWTSVPAWIDNHISSTVSDEITHPLPNFTQWSRENGRDVTCTMAHLWLDDFVFCGVKYSITNVIHQIKVVPKSMRRNYDIDGLYLSFSIWLETQIFCIPLSSVASTTFVYIRQLHPHKNAVAPSCAILIRPFLRIEYVFSRGSKMSMCRLYIPVHLTLIRVATLPRTLWTDPRIQRTRIDAIN